MNNYLVNNTISCYQKPRINYYMNSKSKDKRKTIKEKSFNYNNKENININNVNLNSVQKKQNFFRIYKNKNNKKEKEISLSKNIAFLCGVINSINNTNIKNNIKELIKEKNNNNKKIAKNKYLIKVVKIQKWWRKIYKNKISKITIIQKQWKHYIKNKILNDYYFFSFKKLISSTKNNTTKASTINSNANLLKSFQEETEKETEKEKEIIYINIRKKFISYITQKLSKFFLLILNKLNIFNFVKILSQRINKNIIQYVFYIIYNNKENNNSNDKIFFFETIERHLKVNLNMDENNINEIAILLRTNIPKYFMENYNRNYLPFINLLQEKNLLNTQLFLFNNEKLVNYILFFLEKEKGEILDEEKNIKYRNFIKNYLNLHKLKNRNIFGIMRYINILEKNLEYNNSLYSKLKIMPYKESYHSENIKEDSSNNEFDDEDNYGNMDNDIDIKKFKLKFHYMNNNE